MSRHGARGANTRAVLALIGGPSTQSRALAASLAYATHTASPMARGSRVWNGDPGYGVHQYTRITPSPTGDPSARAIAPVAVPVGARFGFGGGPSSPAAYPSTGNGADYAAVAGLDLGKLDKLGWGG